MSISKYDTDRISRNKKGVAEKNKMIKKEIRLHLEQLSAEGKRGKLARGILQELWEKVK